MHQIPGCVRPTCVVDTVNQAMYTCSAYPPTYSIFSSALLRRYLTNSDKDINQLL